MLSKGTVHTTARQALIISGLLLASLAGGHDLVLCVCAAGHVTLSAACGPESCCPELGEEGVEQPVFSTPAPEASCHCVDIPLLPNLEDPALHAWYPAPNAGPVVIATLAVQTSVLLPDALPAHGNVDVSPTSSLFTPLKSVVLRS